MLDRLKDMFGGKTEKPKEETVSELAAGYYAEAQAAADGDATEAIRQLAFAAELDDSYRVRATGDPAFDGIRHDSRYLLVVTRPPQQP